MSLSVSVIIPAYNAEPTLGRTLSALVAIVDQKLRAPLSVGLGSDGIQRLFSSSGKIVLTDVVETLS